MTEHKTLFEALVGFQKDMPVVGKGNTATVPMKAGGKYSYRYADLADIIRAATPHLTAHGLAFITTPTMTEKGGLVLTGVLLHTSGERIEGALPLHGSTPQELGSSITYMRRYLLGCLTGIVTDEDDDAQAANHAPRAQRAPAQTQSHLSVWVGQIAAGLDRLGVTDGGDKLRWLSDQVGREVASPWELTEDEAKHLASDLVEVP